MEHAELAFHNVAAMPPADRTDLNLESGLVLSRLPERVRTELNPGAQSRYRHPAGVEIRFVGGQDEPLQLTLAATAASDVEVFWGPFRERRVTVGPEPTTLELEHPDRLPGLRGSVRREQAFDPAVCRVRLAGAHRGGVVAFQDVTGARRPPQSEELPDNTYLAYGTSITEGEAPSAEQLTYVAEAARRLGADLRNLGTCGSAYLEPPIAEYIAEQDFDVATLALSVNMIDAFSLETFRERAEYMVRHVADTNPETPIVAITLYPYYDDLMTDGDQERATGFREALEAIVRAVDKPNLHCVQGPALLEPSGLNTDLLHPADAGMITMGERLSGRLEGLLD